MSSKANKLAVQIPFALSTGFQIPLLLASHSDVKLWSSQEIFC